MNNKEMMVKAGLVWTEAEPELIIIMMVEQLIRDVMDD